MSIFICFVHPMSLNKCLMHRKSQTKNEQSNHFDKDNFPFELNWKYFFFFFFKFPQMAQYVYLNVVSFWRRPSPIKMEHISDNHIACWKSLSFVYEFSECEYIDGMFVERVFFFFSLSIEYRQMDLWKFYNFNGHNLNL